MNTAHWCNLALTVLALVPLYYLLRAWRKYEAMGRQWKIWAQKAPTREYKDDTEATATVYFILGLAYLFGSILLLIGIVCLWMFHT